MPRFVVLTKHKNGPVRSTINYCSRSSESNQQARGQNQRHNRNTDPLTPQTRLFSQQLALLRTSINQGIEPNISDLDSQFLDRVTSLIIPQRQLSQDQAVGRSQGQNQTGRDMAPKDTQSKKHISIEKWQKQLDQVTIKKGDMNRLVMNFLVTEGYVEAAQKFQEESGTEPGVDLSSIQDRMNIRKAVQAGDVQGAIERVNDLNPEILESRHELLFHLQQQHLIELIRDKQPEEALLFAKENLAPRGEENPACLEELERTISLLAFDDLSSSPVSDLMDNAQRQKTASELNAAILQSQSQATQSTLPYIIKLLHWSQERLSVKATYPQIQDLSTGVLVDPKAKDS